MNDFSPHIVYIPTCRNHLQEYINENNLDGLCGFCMAPLDMAHAMCAKIVVTGPQGISVYEAVLCREDVSGMIEADDTPLHFKPCSDSNGVEDLGVITGLAVSTSWSSSLNAGDSNV